MADKKNHVRKLREAQLMSKAELARKAGLSPLTIDRVEAGKPSRMDTRRKIILALGYRLSERHKVFPEEGEEAAGVQEQLSFREKGEEPPRDATEGATSKGRTPRRRKTDLPQDGEGAGAGDEPDSATSQGDDPEG